MHDMLEGVVQHLLQFLISYCIEQKKYFNMTLLNSKIEAIEMGYMEDTRPGPVDNSWHIRQNGTLMFFNTMQMLCHPILCPFASTYGWLQCTTR